MELLLINVLKCFNFTIDFNVASTCILEVEGGWIMELQTISQISKQFNISTRTLRYYEQIGLIQPVKKEDFAYRTYDNKTVVRLQQIIILRKLRIPLRQIADILKSEDTAVAINAFSKNLAEIEDEITALSTIKNVIKALLDRLHLQREILRLLDDESLLDIVDSLTVSKIKSVLENPERMM